MTYFFQKVGSHQSSLSSIKKKTKYCLQIIAYCLLITMTGYSQSITRAEYFLDTDPGVGNATDLTVASPGVNVNFNFNVSTNSLSAGFHILGFRIRESGTGFWSHAQYNAFYIVPTVTLSNYLPINISLVTKKKVGSIRES